MSRKVAKKSSKVWNYYTLDNDRAICNLCNASITRKYVTNLRKHLLRIHLFGKSQTDTSISASRKHRATKENFKVNSVQKSPKRKFFSYNSLSAANTKHEMSASDSDIHYKKSRPRTSIVWRFFVQEGEMAECKLCKQKLSFRSLSTTDLKKHLQRIHPYVELLKDNSMSFSNYRVDLSLIPVQTSFDNTSLDDNSLTATGTEPEMPSTCWAIYDLKNKFMKHRIKTSAIWNFFNLEDKFAECKFCKKKLFARSLSTTDLKKHLQRIHPTVELPKVINNSQSHKGKITEDNLNSNPNQTSINENLSDNSENIHTTEQQTSTSYSASNLNDKIKKTGNKTSMIWNSFTVENNVAVCNLCKHSFSLTNLSKFSNLRRHLNQQHPNAHLSKDSSSNDYSYETTEENLNNVVETPFINVLSVDDSEKTINTESGTSISSLELDLNHGFRKNKNKTSSLWNFFTLENETAICKLCGKGISYRFWSLSNLKKHMLRRHPTIELSNDMTITEIAGENFKDNSIDTPFINVLLMDNNENTINTEPVSSVFCSESNLDHEYRKQSEENCLELSKNISVSDVTEHNLNDNSVEIPFINVILIGNSENTINIENSASLSFSDEIVNDTGTKNKIRTSKVWRFYTLENEMAVCKLCKMTYSYKSVSGLRKHLIRRHATEDLPEDINISGNGKSKFTVPNDMEKSVNIKPGVSALCVASALTHGKRKTGKKTSAVWNYFTCKDNKTAVCNFCKMTFSYKSSISDLKKHFIRKHDTGDLSKDTNTLVKNNITEVNVVNKIDQTQCIDEYLTNNPQKNSIAIEPGIVLGEPGIVLCSFSEEESSKFLEKKLSLSTKEILDNLVLDLFIYDFQPFTVVEEMVFQKSMKVLSPSYALPTKKTFMNTLLPARYDKCCNKLKKALSETKISSVILTLDCWKINNRFFLAVICSFINENFHVESKLLECFSFSESEAVSNLAIKLENIAKVWGFENKILLCISDNASNVKLAVKEILKWNYFDCYGYAINSVANDGLELHVYISSIIKKIKSVVQYFKTNADSMKTLLDLQEQLGYAPKELLSDVPVTWSSTFCMLERFVELEVPICSALALVDVVLPGLDSREWKIAAEMVEVLRPLQEVTEMINGEDFLTASSVIIITKGMENAYKEMLDYPLLQETQELVETIVLSIQCHLGDLESNDTLLISTFLDPRFKTVGFSSANTAERAKMLVVNLLESEFKLGETDQGQTENITDNGIPAKKTPTVWNRFDKRVMEFKSDGVTHFQASNEVQCYLEKPLLNRVEDPLKWWRDNCQNYPLLKMLFLKKFAVFATTIPCEHLFSKTNSIPSDWRSHFSLDKMKELLFLNINDQHERSSFFHIQTSQP